MSRCCPSPCLLDLVGLVESILRISKADDSLNHEHEIGSIRQVPSPIVHSKAKLYPHKPQHIEPLTIKKVRQHISNVSIEISGIVLRVESASDKIVHDVIKALQPDPPTIGLVRILPHKAHLLWLGTPLIVDSRVGSMHMPKSKDPTESDKVHSVMTTIRHPMYLICILVLEICGMKLS